MRTPVVCAACTTWMYSIVSTKVKICVPTLERSLLDRSKTYSNVSDLVVQGHLSACILDRRPNPITTEGTQAQSRKNLRANSTGAHCC